MANRSYLYVVTHENSDPSSTEAETWALSEWNWSVPLSHILLVSSNPKQVKSHAWDVDESIAVVGDFKKGRERLYSFLEALRKRQLFDSDELDKAMREAHEALDRFQDDGLFTLLEPGEIIDLCSDDLSGWEEIIYRMVISEAEGFDHADLSESSWSEYLDYLEDECDAKGAEEVWASLGLCWCRLTWLGLEQVKAVSQESVESNSQVFVNTSEKPVQWVDQGQSPSVRSEQVRGKRPTAVTVICVIEIIASVLTAALMIPVLGQLTRQSSAAGVLGLLVFIILVFVVALSVLMLRGSNLARHLFTISAIISTLLGLFTGVTPSRIGNLMLTVVFVAILYSETSSRFFKPEA